MGNRAFAVADGIAVAFANDVDDFRYRAVSISVPVGVQTEARMAESLEMHFLIEDGLVEFMINGGTAMLLPGDFVRVPLGRRHLVGVVWDGAPSGDVPEERLKAVAQRLDLPPEDLDAPPFGLKRLSDGVGHGRGLLRVEDGRLKAPPPCVSHLKAPPFASRFVEVKGSCEASRLLARTPAGRPKRAHALCVGGQRGRG